MIDNQRLLCCIKDVLIEENYNKYDFNSLITQAQSCWDDTAIQIKGVDFTMIFDKISYELLEYEGNDINDV